MKSLQLGAVKAFLGKAMDAPEPLAVANALELLGNIGALDEQEALTPLGLSLLQCIVLSIDITCACSKAWLIHVKRIRGPQIVGFQACLNLWAWTGP